MLAIHFNRFFGSLYKSVEKKKHQEHSKYIIGKLLISQLLVINWQALVINDYTACRLQHSHCVRQLNPITTQMKNSNYDDAGEKSKLRRRRPKIQITTAQVTKSKLRRLGLGLLLTTCNCSVQRLFLQQK